MGTFPKDCKGRVIGSTAKGIFHYQLQKKHWEYHESIGADSGTDCVIELIENEEFHNQKIECQIKGTTKAEHKKYKNITVSLLPEDYETIKNLAEKENKTISKFLVGLAIKKDT